MTTATIERPAVTPGQRPFRPYGAVEELFYCRAPEVLLAGPAGTGKSRGCLEKLHLCALKYAGMRGLIARKTRDSLTQSALVTFEKEVLPEGAPIRLHHESQEYRYPNGSRIVVGGLDKPSKIMSTQYDLAYVQEATEVRDADWEAIVTRLRNGVMPYQQLAADCNPDGPEHWLKKRCDDGTTRLIESRHQDNPTLYDAARGEWTAFGRAYIEERLGKLSGYRFKRLKEGLWVAAEGMFFWEWDPDLHVCEPFDIPADWPRWVTVDYGFAAPFCALWLARDPASRRVYAYRELYGPGLRDEQQAQRVAEKCDGERIVLRVGDPSMFAERREQNKPSIASVYAQNGVQLVPGSNSRIAGWQTVRRFLAHDAEKRIAPRARIFRGRCPNLVRTLPAMVHDPLDPEDLADEIRGVKTEDHALDAFRYGLQAEANLTTTWGAKARPMSVAGRSSRPEDHDDAHERLSPQSFRHPGGNVFLGRGREEKRR